MTSRFIYLMIFIIITSLYVGNVNADNKPQLNLLDKTKSTEKTYSSDSSEVVPVWLIVYGHELDIFLDDEVYLYQQSVAIKDRDGNEYPIDLPPPVIKEDPLFGKVPVYFKELRIDISFLPVEKNSNYIITYQGCSLNGICYPYYQQELNWSAQGWALEDQEILEEEPKYAKVLKEDQKTEVPTTKPNNHKSKLARYFQSSNIWILAFIAMGIFIAFSPCVLPMLPLLNIAIGIQNDMPIRRRISLAFSYIQGMALVYAALGLIVANLGLAVTQFLQSPAVLTILTLMFLLIALNSFGIAKIPISSRLNNKLNLMMDKVQGKSVFPAFMLGVLAALVASPCTTGPLAAVLIYVATEGDYIKGALSLYLLALGMGLPLMVISLGGEQLIKKGKRGMLLAQKIMAWLILYLAFDFFSRMFELGVYFLMVSLWMTLLLIHLIYTYKSSWIRSSFTALIAVGVILFTSYNFSEIKSVYSEKTLIANPNYIKLESPKDLIDSNKIDKSKPTLVIFYADWCFECIRAEKLVYSNSEVFNTLINFNLVKVDLTISTPESKIWQNQLKILGLPNYFILPVQAKELSQGITVLGYRDAKSFMRDLKPFLVQPKSP